MYKQHFNSFRGRGSRGNGSFQRGPSQRARFSPERSRRIKTFDPTSVVRNAPAQTKEETYVSKHTFEAFPISEQLKKNIRSAGFTTPTPIQDQAIPEILKGRDVVGIANTGTGKTAAFLIPLINKVHSDRTQKVLIIAPTRELAGQIQDDLAVLSKSMGIFSTLCIGGVGMGGQIHGLRNNPQFVIGTPGRLKDLDNQRRLNFASFNNIVLDEVDRMLDMGFVHDVKYIVSRLGGARHSLFFSATVPAEVQGIMRSFAKDPVTISVKIQEILQNVNQEVLKVNGKNKIDMLHELLQKEGFSKVLVFGRTKRGIEKLAIELRSRRLKVASIHGNKSQGQRQRALDEFKDNRVQVLLATNLASRGIDVDDITHVINFDLPESYEDYIHRIGRTGRANKTGVALTFVD